MEIEIVDDTVLLNELLHLQLSMVMKLSMLLCNSNVTNCNFICVLKIKCFKDGECVMVMRKLYGEVTWKNVIVDLFLLSSFKIGRIIMMHIVLFHCNRKKN